jgi:hypothetical protein
MIMTKITVSILFEQKLRMFEKRMLRRISRPQKEEIAGGRRRLRNEDLHNLYTSPDIIMMRMRWAEHKAHMGEM